MSKNKKKKKKIGNSLIAGIVKMGADWFYRARIIAPKKGKGRKKRPRNSNRDRERE